MKSYSYLTEKWQLSGIESGDTVLVHSNVTRTLLEARKLKIRLRPEDIVLSFLDAVGTEGTVLFPLFNFDFAQGLPFDLRTTPSQMGAVTNAARIMEGTVRTGHPIYSFAVLGAGKDKFAGIDNLSGYAQDSPFGKLRELNGKIASLDLPDGHSMTFYHHVEECCQVDYRYFKDFTGEYTDLEGKTTLKTYKLFVRDLDRGVTTFLDPAGEMMWQAGLYKGDRPLEGSGLRTIRAVEMFDFVKEIIESGRALGTLYQIRK